MRVIAEAAALQRMLDVALALAAERRTEPVLRTILEAARDLAAARYAAIGVPDGDGGFTLFLTSGVDAATWEAIGSLPRSHGLLGALLERPEPIRVDDIRADPRFRGWPPAHPVMRSFLGVPIAAGGEILAELYLAEKTGAGGFTDADQRLMETLAAHAALAVANAQRQERARELSVAQERNRFARDLHDSVTQTLFSLSLSAEAAATLARGADGRLAAELDRVRLLSAEAMGELRSLVDALRAPDLDREGLAVALRKRVQLLRRVHDTTIELTVSGRRRPRDPTVEREVMLVATEALANALRHAGSRGIRVGLDIGEQVRLTVEDDGRGFDLAGTLRTTRRLGLVSMLERVEALGGTLHIDSRPGEGTRVIVEVPAG